MDHRSMSAGDGESSVSGSQTGITFCKDVLDSAAGACFEVQVIAEVLQGLIESRDSCGHVFPVSRGMLMRVVALSEALSIFLSGEADAEELASAGRTVRGLA